jgi:cytochrome c5
MYSLVIGALVVVALASYLLASKMASETQDVYIKESPEYRAAVAARIRPVGDVYTDNEERAASAPTIEIAADPEPVAAAMSGPQVYNSACGVCHGAGVGGAPILGNASMWADRIAQGADVLKQHAIEGYTGSTGYMPAKGGRADLSDAEIENAVDYMASESQ